MPTYLAAQPASDGASSADDALILKTVQKADSVLSYFDNSIGEGEYKVSQA